MSRPLWLAAMRDFFGNDEQRIDHTLLVLRFAEDIAKGESVPALHFNTITAAAIFHDIGIPEAIRKHGSSAAPYQEQEGADIVRVILESFGEPDEFVDRIAYIVGHHHTQDKIDDVDFQVIWEADLLVNLAKKKSILEDRSRLEEVIDKNFKTRTGRGLAQEIYLEKQSA